MKQQCPDREPGRDEPCGDTENLRPQTKPLIAQIAAMSKPKTKTKTGAGEKGAGTTEARSVIGSALPFSAFMILSEKLASFF